MFKNGNIIYADGLLYSYSEAGQVGIVDPKSNDFSLISSFDIPYGEKWHWAHLVIYDKKLYVRHDHSLMVYDIAGKYEVRELSLIRLIFTNCFHWAH